uniref:Phosphatidylinositol-specific phospholipase C X domain-containing protein n=1 Tax=Leersia perrieri TaxID=77586 RepID=A0A0D9WYM1_9ORYZ
MGSAISNAAEHNPIGFVLNPLAALGIDQFKHLEEANAQEQALADLLSSSGDSFPGSGYHPANRKSWMESIGPNRLRFHQVVWPGTHDSATNGIGNLMTRPFAECQTLSVYDQLSLGCRVLDVRVREDRTVCHGILSSYHVDVVLDDLKRFLAETTSEVVILEIRTEFDQQDPPDFARYLVDKLGDHLIPQDEQVFNRTIAELLPRRVICVWKPRQSPAPNPGDLLWSGGYLRDDWIDTDMPKTKFDSNLDKLSQNPPVSERKYFYRVENTVTPTTSSVSSLTVEPVTRRIHRFARLFISRAVATGNGSKLQVLSTDFIDEDFVDACAGFSMARIERNPGT